MKYAVINFLIFVLLYLIVAIVIRPSRRFDIFFPISRDFSTVIKGAAISCIVYGHLGNYFGIRYLTPLGSIGVAMFLIVSGYGINESWKKNGPHAYWRKRFASVFLPYAIIELIFLPLRGGGAPSDKRCLT